MGITSRTGRSKLEASELWTVAHSMPRLGWMTSITGSAEPGAAANDRLSGWPAQEWRSNCAQHASDGMINVNRRKCSKESCGTGRSLGVAGTKTAECCAEHALDGMVDFTSRKCTWRSYGVASTKTVEYCVQHAPDGMVDVKSRKCRTEGCDKWPSYGVKGKTTAEYCAQHAPDEMVNVKSRK